MLLPRVTSVSVVPRLVERTATFTRSRPSVRRICSWKGAKARVEMRPEPALAMPEVMAPWVAPEVAPAAPTLATLPGLMRMATISSCRRLGVELGTMARLLRVPWMSRFTV